MAIVPGPATLALIALFWLQVPTEADAASMSEEDLEEVEDALSNDFEIGFAIKDQVNRREAEGAHVEGVWVRGVHGCMSCWARSIEVA